MAKSITTAVGGLANANLRSALDKLQRGAVDVAMTTGGLCIGTSSKKKVKIATTIYALVDGVFVAKTTAEVAFTATTHDVTNAKFRIFMLSLQADGTVTITAGTEGATLAAATVPTLPDDEALIGFIIINPTGTGNFDATTTDLDDATVVPGAVYIDTPYPFNPNSVSL